MGLKNARFCAIREEIRKKKQSPENQWTYKIGKERQKIAILALQELKDKELIYNFWPTSEDSFQDIVKGIDFYVSYFNGARRRVFFFSITGERWAKKDRDRHPNVPVITIDFSDNSDSIKSKIMEAISQNK